MAKNMAYIINGVVENILWCSDKEPESSVKKLTYNLPVAVGDTYKDGVYYRDGKEVLTEREEYLLSENEYLLNTIANTVEETYASDMEMMGI